MNNFIKAFLIWICVIAQLNFAVAQTTTAALLPPGVAQFLDNNGNPLTSGTVGFYLPGTLTFATTWQDSLETIPNTNPIKLDAGGKALIYGNQTYRQIVKDRNGNLIWDAVTAPGGGGGSSPILVGDGEPVGTIKQWAGLVIPNQYAYAAGQQISRTTFSALLAAITQQLNVACTLGSNVFTAISDTSQINIGSPVEFICVAPGTTVVSKTNSSVTLSNVSTLTLNTLATFFPFGNGDGSTTFNVPDLRGNIVAGRPNMNGTTATNLTSTYFGNNPDALGAIGGSQSHTQTISEMAMHNHSATSSTSAAFTDSGAATTFGYNSLTGGSGGGIKILNLFNGAGAPSIPSTITSATVTSIINQGSSTPFPIVQPTIILNYIIKTTPDTPISSATGVMSLGGMVGVIACGQGLNCSANTISANGQLAAGINTNIQFNQNAQFGGSSNFNFISPNTITIGGNGVVGNLKIVATNSGISPSNLTGTLLQLAGQNSTPARIEINAYGGQAFFTSVAWGGTVVTPTSLTTDTQIGGYNAYGYNGASIVGPVATFRQFAAENWIAGKQGAYAEIATTSISSSTLTTRIRFENDGGITVPPTVTGGDKGLGSINLSGLAYTNGNAFANTASSPIILNSTTGNVTCPTCATSSGGGAITGTSPISVSVAGVVAITGSALTSNNDTNVTLTLGGTPNTALITPASLTLGWLGQLSVSRGGTGLASGISGGIPYFNTTTTISSSALLTVNQIMIGGGAGAAPTTFNCATSTTVVHGGTPPTCGQIVFGDITTNTITNSNLSQIGAATIKGNPTASLANVQDFTVQGLTNLASPSPTLDFIPIYDHATGLLKNVTPGAIAGSVVAGVASLNTLTGSLVIAVTAGLNINNTSSTTITITPDIATTANFEAGTANKLLDAATVFSPETTTTFGSTTAFDFNTFINTKVTLTGNITTMNCSNMKPSQAGTITYVQDSSGSRTAAFSSGTCSTILKFAGATFPTLTTSASAIDVLSYSCRTSSYCAASLSKGYNP